MGVEVGGRNVWRRWRAVAATVIGIAALVAARPAAGTAEPIAAAPAVAVATPSASPTTGPGTDEVVSVVNYPSASSAASTVVRSMAEHGEAGLALAGDLTASLVVGGQALVPTGGSDVWVSAQHDVGTAPVWVHQFGGAGLQEDVEIAKLFSPTYGQLVAFTTDAAIDVDGTSIVPAGGTAVVVVWIDGASGDIGWVRTVDSPGDDRLIDVAGYGTLGAVAVATSAPLDVGVDATGAGYSVVTFGDGGVVRGVTDAVDEELVWGTSIPSLAAGDEVVLAFTYISPSAVPGTTLPWNQWPSGVVVRYDADGALVDAKALQGAQGVVPVDVAVDGDADAVAVAGYTASDLTLGDDSVGGGGFVARFDDVLQPTWLRGLPNGSFADVDAAYGKVVVGGAFVGTTALGMLSYQSAGGTDAVVAGLDAAGNWRWVETSGGTSDDAITDVSATATTYDAAAIGSHTAAATVGSQLLAGSGAFVASYAGPDRTGLSYVPIVPTRVLDTRTSLGNHPFPVDALGAMVQVAGVSGVPDDASAVVANVTVTGAVAPSHLTLWPTGSDRPATSNLNYGPGETVANLVTIPVGIDGHLSMTNNAMWAHVIIDVVGIYRWSNTDPVFKGLTPARLLDSRDGTGGYGSPWGQGADRDLLVAGVGGVPADASAVVVNLTATNVTAATHLTVWPDGVTMPVASNLNLVPGQTRPNLAIVQVGAGGRIRIFNNAGTTDVIADVVGYYAHRPQSGGRLNLIDPQRIVDSRSGIGGWSTPLAATTRSFDVAGTAGVPSTASAAVMNVTVTGPTAPSHLTLWPAGGAKPLASNLNYVTNQTVPNAAISGLGSGGQVSASNNTGTTQVIVDLFGWFS